MLYFGSIWVTPTVVGRLLLVVGALVEPPVNEVKENWAGAGPTSANARTATAINGKSLRTLCLPLASCQRLNCENPVPRGEQNSVRGNRVKPEFHETPEFLSEPRTQRSGVSGVNRLLRYAACAARALYSKPSLWSWPNMRLKFCTATPLAPRTRLSSATSTTTRPRTTRTAMSRKLVCALSLVAGSRLLTRTNGAAA